MLVTRNVQFITSRASLAAAVVALGLLALPRGAARAQGAVPAGSGYSPSIGASAGIVFPTGDLGNGVNSGYAIAVSVGLQQASDPLGFRLEGLFNEFGIKGQDAKYRMYAGTANLVYDLNAGTATAGVQSTGGFYLVGGLGLYGTKVVVGTNGTGTQTDFGVNGGGGYRLPLSGFSVYFEARYHAIFSSPGQQILPITVGVEF